MLKKTFKMINLAVMKSFLILDAIRPQGAVDGLYIRVGDYVDNLFTALGSIATTGKLGSSSILAFMFFIFYLFKFVLFFVN